MSSNFEIKKHYGSFGKAEKGTWFEVNQVSWFGQHEKIDIRNWRSENGESVPCRGIDLTKEEVADLILILQHVLSEEENPDKE